MRTTVLLWTLLAAPVFTATAHAGDRPAGTNRIHKKEQQFEQEVKTERDRPAKKERAKAAAGRVEDGVREFGRGLQGVMQDAGIGDGPADRRKASGGAKPKAARAPATPAGKTAAPAPAPAPSTPPAKPAAPAAPPAAPPK
jgi:hypothetical protein